MKFPSPTNQILKEYLAKPILVELEVNNAFVGQIQGVFSKNPDNTYLIENDKCPNNWLTFAANQVLLLEIVADNVVLKVKI